MVNANIPELANERRSPTYLFPSPPILTALGSATITKIPKNMIRYPKYSYLCKYFPIRMVKSPTNILHQLARIIQCEETVKAHPTINRKLLRFKKKALIAVFLMFSKQKSALKLIFSPL